MSFIYLGSPYTHTDPEVMESRYIAACAHTANLLASGKHVYSPIVHCHELAKRHDLPREFDFWQQYNFAMLSKASELHVFTLPGWYTSKGLRHEIRFAKKCGIATIQVHPTDEELSCRGS